MKNIGVTALIKNLGEQGGGGSEIGTFMKQKSPYQLCWLTTQGEGRKFGKTKEISAKNIGL